jgi:pimeloyl-ACP methyl ester carboxylesterase
MLSVGDCAYRAGMKVILVPGFWLGAWSWDRIVPALEAVGHEVRPLTLPGLESVDADRSGIGLAEHVAAVRAVVDETDEPVVLVGHSGGGAVVHAVVDQRPGQVARAVYVDSGPLPHGSAVNPRLPAEGAVLAEDVPRREGEVGARDLDDFTEAQLADFRARAVPHPAGAARDPQVLGDEARWGVPVTLITTTFTTDEIDQYTAAGEAYFAELPHLDDLTIVELPTGHWPQFSRTEQLAELLRDTIGTTTR